MKAKFLGSDLLFCFISICKLGSFKNLSATINSLSKLYFRFNRVYSVGANEKSDFYELWQQYKQLKTMEMRLELILTMKGIYIDFQPESTKKITRSSRCTELKDILNDVQNISQLITKTVPISTRTVISYTMKRGIPL